MPPMPKVKSNPRSVRSQVLAHLMRIQEDAAYISRLRLGQGSDRNRRAVRNYVSGITRWQRWLDFQIAAHYKGRFKKLEHRLLMILRIGVYDLTIRKNAPHAALNEAVALAKKTVRPRAGNLVNGILRAMTRNLDQLPEPEKEDLAQYLGIQYSHPDWMVRRWLTMWNQDEVYNLLHHNNKPPVFTLRVNLLKTTVDEVQERLTKGGISCLPSQYLPGTIQLQQLQALQATRVLDEGLGAIQDEAAALVVEVMNPRMGNDLLDVCAAPGGKALYAAMKMKNQGRLVALDRHAGKLALLEKAAKQHGLSIIEAHQHDALHPIPFPKADGVLLDAPCTGTGVLAKRADLRWRKTESDLHDLVQLQQKLLDIAAHAVKPGGVLVYSTCSIEPEENQEQVAAFLARHSAFKTESAAELVPQEMVTPEGYYQALPQRHGTDGAFAARLRRTSS